METLQEAARAFLVERPKVAAVREALAAAERAVAHLAEAHLRLAVQYALGTDAHGLAQDDLVQECMLAVMRTAGEFDPDHVPRCQFASRAAWWLRHYSERAIQRQGADVRQPPAVMAARQRIVRAVDAHESAHGALPAPAQLAGAARVSEAVAERGLAWMRGAGRVRPLPSTDRVDDEVGRPFGGAGVPLELQSPELADGGERAEREEQISALRSALLRLPEARRRLVAAAHGLDGKDGGRLPVREVAGALGLRPREAERELEAGIADLRRVLAGHGGRPAVL
jgi:RNA polymerase sigma factor (sigma-70 family)